MVAAGDRKCRALALSGGGDKGSYQASVFIEFTNLLKKEDVAYDVVTGASAGSLNGAGLSLFAAGEEDQAALFIYGLWNSITTSDILKQWDEGILAGIFTKSGLFSNQPLIDFLTEQVGPRSIKKKFTVVLTDADDGISDHVDFNSSETIPPDAIPTIVGSSAIPFAFPHMVMDGKTYIDGGCIWNLDVSGAIRRCKEIVDDEKDIIVDIILCSEYSLASAGELSKYNALAHMMRARAIEEYIDLMQDIKRSLIDHPDVNFRYVLGPSETLSNSPIPLDFSKEHLDKCFEIGKNDARRAIQLGEGGYRDAMIEFFDRTQAGERFSFQHLLDEKLSHAKSNTTLISD